MKLTTELYCIIHTDEPTEIVFSRLYDSYDEAFSHKGLGNTTVVSLDEALDKIKAFLFEEGIESGIYMQKNIINK